MLNKIEEAIEDIKNGRLVIVVDDEDRENEGDLIYAASNLTIDHMVTMIRDCSGIICLCLTEEKANELSLQLMVNTNTSQYQTAFTTSIEAAEGVSTGVSAQDRWTTIKAAIKPDAKPSDLCRPGHIFPLIARKNGVLDRRGHTEGSVDLLKLAKLPPSAVLCELMNPDGTMKKTQQLIEYAVAHHLTMLSVEDIYQCRQEALTK
jgi:3,4-dihydroxy 2-butanone 4-phosphate synthase